MSSSSLVTVICVEPTMPLSSPIESNTSSSRASVSGGTSAGTALLALSARPSTVLTQPDSASTAASATSGARISRPASRA
jgi:hypothetical protein